MPRSWPTRRLVETLARVSRHINELSDYRDQLERAVHERSSAKSPADTRCLLGELKRLGDRRHVLEARRSVPGFDAGGLSEAEWQRVAGEIAEIEAREQRILRALGRLPNAAPAGDDGEPVYPLDYDPREDIPRPGEQ